MFRVNSILHSVYNSSPVVAKSIIASLYGFWSGRTKYGGVYPRWRDFLSESQWWNSEQLRAYQTSQLADLLNFVYAQSPYYRKLMDERGIEPLSGDSFRDLQAFPMLSKQTLKEHFEAIRPSMSTNKRLVLSTSGTTGTSLHVPLTREAVQREYAFRWQFQSVANAKRGDRLAFFTGHRVLPVKRENPPFFIRNFWENSLMFSVYHMSDATMHSYVEALNTFKPKCYYGFPSAMFVLADFVRRKKLTVFSPTAMFCSSERLHPYQRKVIQEALNAPLYQWYGQTEISVNIHECEHHRLHVKEEYGLLELLKDDGTEAQPGEVGEAVTTGWGNRALPLIRYWTQDCMRLAKEQTCPCGRGGRIIEEIMGRDNDFIVTPEGRLVARLGYVLQPITTVKEAQIVQESINSIVVKVVSWGNFTSQDEATIIRSLRERIGKAFSIRIEKVHDIERDAGGKVRYVVSKVSAGLSNGSFLGWLWLAASELSVTLLWSKLLRFLVCEGYSML